MTTRAQAEVLLRTLFPWAQSLSAPLQAALAALPLAQIPAGQMLFDEGSPCAHFPLLLQGEIDVVKLSPQGRSILLYQVQPGEPCVISQSCLLGQRDYMARGLARSPVLLLALPGTLFDTLIAEHPPFRRAIFAVFGVRLAELMATVDEVAFKRLDQRLARVLLERGPQLRSTHQALADELGSVREIVSRVLHQFATAGWVELGRERIVVLDAEALRHRSQE